MNWKRIYQMNEEGLRFFTDRERGIYNEWKELPTRKPLSVTTSLKMYELFLNGYSCEEVARLNDHKFPSGMILEARLRDTWDDRRQQHLAELYGGIFDKVRQTQTEAVAFVADLLSAAHKKHGDKLKKFLQSGDQADLGALSIDTMTSYKTAADMLMKLTGQDKEKSPVGNKTVVVGTNVSVMSTEDKPTLEDGNVVTSNIADRILQFLEAGESKKK